MPVPKALMTMAVPTIISQLITLIYNMADVYFVGRTGNPYMIAAVSLVTPLFFMCNSLVNLFGIGGGSLMSRLLGQHEDEQASKVCVMSFYLSAIGSVIYSLICLTFLDRILFAFGASAHTLPFARQYASWVVVYGALPTVLGGTMAFLLRSVGCAREAGFGQGMGGVINVGLDPLFMFVLMPKGSEVAGAAIATMLSNTVTVIYFLFVLYRLCGKTVITLSPHIGMPRRSNVLGIFSVGLPSAITTLLFDVSLIFTDKLMASHGDEALAAMGIVLKAERLPLNTGLGLCQGMMPIVAYNYAAGNYERMRKTLNFARLCGLCMAAVSIVLCTVFAHPIIELFIQQGAAAALTTVTLGAGFLRARCLATPFMFMNFHFAYFFQALGNGPVTLMLAAFRQCIFNIPIMFLLNYLGGAYGLVWTQLVADCLTLVVAFTVYFRQQKRLEARGLQS